MHLHTSLLFPKGLTVIPFLFRLSFQNSDNINSYLDKTQKKNLFVLYNLPFSLFCSVFLFCRLSSSLSFHVSTRYTFTSINEIIPWWDWSFYKLIIYLLSFFLFSHLCKNAKKNNFSRFSLFVVDFFLHYSLRNRIKYCFIKIILFSFFVKCHRHPFQIFWVGVSMFCNEKWHACKDTKCKSNHSFASFYEFPGLKMQKKWRTKDRDKKAWFDCLT